jgi:hypothetical protein
VLHARFIVVDQLIGSVHLCGGLLVHYARGDRKGGGC